MFPKQSARAVDCQGAQNDATHTGNNEPVVLALRPTTSGGLRRGWDATAQTNTKGCRTDLSPNKVNGMRLSDLPPNACAHVDATDAEKDHDALRWEETQIETAAHPTVRQTDVA
jgi:hypothetical protein